MIKNDKLRNGATGEGGWQAGEKMPGYTYSIRFLHVKPCQSKGGADYEKQTGAPNHRGGKV